MSRIRAQQSVEGLLLDWSITQPLPDRRLPVSLLSKAQKATELQRVQARRAMDAAYEAELVMGLAYDTPDTLDPPPGHPGAKKGSWAPDAKLPGVSEFFPAALAAGALDEARAKVLVDVLAHTSPAVAREIEARLLPEATGLSTGRLRASALARLLEHAVDARRKDAKRQADVRSYPSHLEGMSTLAADLPTPVSAECLDVVDQLAKDARGRRRPPPDR